ncbi:MAG: hypothetical protein GEU78_10390 [Actinobacteria bacterium]|nr:hypothetical protein [Actinomycetota bacterium]
MTVGTNEGVYARQLEIEKQMFDEGLVRHRERMVQARDGSRFGTTSPGRALINRYMGPVIEAVEIELKKAKRGLPGRNSIASKYLELFKPEVSAYVALRSIVNDLGRHTKLSTMAIHIGSQLEYEARFRSFNAQNPELYATLIRDLKGRTRSDEHARKVVLSQMGKAKIQWEGWPTKEKLHLGAKLIDTIMTRTELIDRYDERIGRRQYTYIRPTKKMMDLIEDVDTGAQWFQPVYVPMVVPPSDWVNTRTGGYLTPGLHGSTLIKTHNEAHLDEIDNHNMPMVYDALNAIQSTAWRVNTLLLTVLRDAWAAGLEIGDLPSRTDASLPPRVGFPEGVDPKGMSEAERQALTMWKRAAAAVYKHNASNQSRRISAVKKLYIADRFSAEPEIYFPHNLDWRGRAYPIPTFLNPQSDDVGKALLEFADGKPLGEQGAAWLAIHLANLWGEDKVSLQDRIDWTQYNSEHVVRSAADPLGYRWWTEADKPWQFLAACMEWAGYVEQGVGYVSRVPVAVDGTCNGLQNFAAMLRDEKGGEAVNLLPAEAPQDIYQRVADNVTNRLTYISGRKGDEVLHHDQPDIDMAARWLDFGVTRKVVKRPVMTLPYGATKFGFRSMIMDDTLVPARIEMGEAFPFEYPMDAATFLADLVWEAVGEEISAAQTAMEWLQEASRVATADGLPLHWTSPSGLLVTQDYKRQKTIALETNVQNRRVQLKIKENTNKIDKRKQANGIAPNFVHSCDAAHMMRSALLFFVNVLDQGGTPSFASVHDSFATHACDVELLGICIRKAFVEQYSEDVLEQFRSEVCVQISDKAGAQIPSIPSKGTLDLNRVLDADFFFA